MTPATCKRSTRSTSRALCGCTYTDGCNPWAYPSPGHCGSGTLRCQASEASSPTIALRRACRVCPCFLRHLLTLPPIALYQCYAPDPALNTRCTALGLTTTTWASIGFRCHYDEAASQASTEWLAAGLKARDLMLSRIVEDSCTNTALGGGWPSCKFLSFESAVVSSVSNAEARTVYAVMNTFVQLLCVEYELTVGLSGNSICSRRSDRTSMRVGDHLYRFMDTSIDTAPCVPGLSALLHHPDI